MLISFVFGAIWLSGQRSDDRTLAALFPAGALVYLEAKDLRGLVTQWSSSNEKRAWLSSDNFGILSRSRLVQRLGEARDQFATVAGIRSRLIYSKSFLAAGLRLPSMISRI